MPESETPSTSTRLKPTLGVVALTIYGVGNMLGAGIYGLIGEAAGLMGNMLWLGFAGAMLAAALTGLSYASLGSRYPRAAGAAYITHRAFKKPMLAYVIGLAVMASGLTSMATTSQVFGAYAYGLFTPEPPAKPKAVTASDQNSTTATATATAAPIANTPPTAKKPQPLGQRLIVLGFIVMLGAINFIGMRESAWLNAVCTVIETGGLLLVIAVGVRYWGSVDYFDPTTPINPTGGFSMPLMLSGAVLTFYAFIGFEDLLNVSEEVHNPRRTLPIGLLAALAIATLVYMAVCITAVSVVRPARLAELASNRGALVEVVRVAAPWIPTAVFSAIALFAVTNTSLLNYIMGSRLAYGMARQGLLPRFLGRVHASRRTPHSAILILMLIVLALTMIGDLGALATATALLLLGSFTAMNLALVRLKLTPGEPRGGFEVPLFVPIGGALVSVTLIVNRIVDGLRTGKMLPIYIAGGIVAGILLMYLALRPKAVEMADAAVESAPQ